MGGAKKHQFNLFQVFSNGKTGIILHNKNRTIPIAFNSNNVWFVYFLYNLLVAYKKTTVL